MMLGGVGICMTDAKARCTAFGDADALFVQVL